MELEDIDGVPLYRNDHKDLEELSAFKETPLGEYFETELTEDSFYQMGNEVAMKSPFGENSMFFKGIRESFGNLEDPNEGKWRYRLKQSQSGKNLVEEYKKYDTVLAESKGKNDLEIDFIIYIEDDHKVDLGKVLLIKMSNTMIQYYLDHFVSNPTKDLLLSWSRSIAIEQKNNANFQVTVADLKHAFITEIEYRVLQNKNVFEVSNINFIDKIFEGISDAFRVLKLSRERWDPTLNSNTYLFRFVPKGIEFLQAKIESTITLLLEIIEKLETVKFITSLATITIVRDFQFIDHVIRVLKIWIANLNSVSTLLIQHKYEKPLFFAFWCGVYNGLVEFFGGIVDIILLVIQVSIYKDVALSSEFKIDVISLREGLEELIEQWIANPNILMDEFEKTLDQYIEKRYRDNALTPYQISHNIGEDSIIVIDIVISIITIVKGLGKLTGKLSKFTEWIDAILARNPKFSSQD